MITAFLTAATLLLGSEGGSTMERPGKRMRSLCERVMDARSACPRTRSRWESAMWPFRQIIQRSDGSRSIRTAVPHIQSRSSSSSSLAGGFTSSARTSYPSGTGSSATAPAKWLFIRRPCMVGLVRAMSSGTWPPGAFSPALSRRAASRHPHGSTTLRPIILAPPDNKGLELTRSGHQRPPALAAQSRVGRTGVRS